MPDRAIGAPARPSPPRARAALWRPLALVLALVLLLMFTAVARPGATAQAGVPAEGVKRAVIVVGPVGGQTDAWLRRGRAVAEAAERNGMEVVRVFHPYATWSRVVAAANGADLFVYLGHGNGWPSPHGPFQEDTKNGVGLNPRAGETDAHKVRYMGANRIIEEIRFAPDAIVILNKLCYAAGNGEDGHPIPSRAVAFERVDNYAAGFLEAGARTVFALTWQPGGTIVDALFSERATMDGLFRMRFGTASGAARPAAGWVGWRPDVYAESGRTPGALLHLDPEPTSGYLRAVSGDLDMTTDEWLASGGPPEDVPPDTEPPALSGISVPQAADTIVASEGAAVVFTPNGDRLSETLRIRHSLSEPAWLKVEIKRVATGSVVRRILEWRTAGTSRTSWDGRRNDGSRAPDGKYRITLTPRDRAGNVGESISIATRVLTALRAPSTTPALFDPTDGDALAASTRFSARLRKAARVSWSVLDAQGALVRTGPTDVELPAGRASFEWDGTNDEGAPVSRGLYTALVTAATEDGAYAHTTRVRAAPFVLESDDWTLRRGQTARLVIDSAEPVAGRPSITVKQPGLEVFRLTVRRVSETRFTAPLTARSGGRLGRIRVTVESTDTAGGIQSQTFSLRLR